ncbi:hypothetical protein MMC11_007249 [Xylographa trunciseda]|nr:hypothetical protein [Xylographa trunciseda]
MTLTRCDAAIACYCTSPGSDQYIACVRSACDAGGLQQFITIYEQNCRFFGGLVTSSGAPASTAANVATTIVVQTSGIATSSQAATTIPQAATTVTSVAGGTPTTLMQSTFQPATTVASVAGGTLTTLIQSTFQPATAAAASSFSTVTQVVFPVASAVTNSAATQPTSGAGATNGTVAKSTNVGAIAGGVVGGVVLILVILASVWRRLRNTGVFVVPTGPINPHGAGAGGYDGKEDGAPYAEEEKVELPSGVDSAPVSSGAKPESLSTVAVDEVEEHPHRF